MFGMLTGEATEKISKEVAESISNGAATWSGYTTTISISKGISDGLQQTCLSMHVYWGIMYDNRVVE